MTSMLAATRFVHYINIIMREKSDELMTRESVEAFLNSWISQYILLDDTAPEEVKASYPLRAANIQIIDNPSKSDSYLATINLTPHFQMEDLSTPIRLQAELTA